MATMPPGAPAAADPAAVDPTAPEQGGTAVTITKMPDGTYTVAPEDDDMAQPAPAEPGAPGMPPEAEQGQPAKTIDEALELARTMLEGEGGMSVEQAFQGGFEGQPAKGPY